MDPKDVLTKTLLEHIGIEVNDVNIKKYKKTFWQNYRKKGLRGMRLTDAGVLAFDTADIKSYKIDIPKDTEWTSQLIIWLDNFIDCPYYIDKKSLIVYSEKIAVQLILFSGDLQKFGRAKSKSVANKQLDEME